MEIVISKIPGYSPGSQTRVIEWMTREQARGYVDTGAARWVNRCKGVQFLKHDDMPVVDDESCRMGPRVTESNAAGEKWAKALVRAWKPVLGLKISLQDSL